MDVRTNQFIKWDTLAGADSYDVELSQLDGTVVRVSNVTDTQIWVRDLFAGIPIGSTRRVRVRGQDAFGLGKYSEYLSPLVLVGLPAPENVRVE